MGLNRRFTCYTNSSVTSIPNPNPSRWTLVQKIEYSGGYVLKVRYWDCTNYEGIKIMVYKGKYFTKDSLDPHFSPNGGPVARFEPTEEGWRVANELAKSL